MTVVAGAWTCDQNVALSLLYKYPTLCLSRDHNRTLKFLSKTHQPDSKRDPQFPKTYISEKFYKVLTLC